MAARECIQCGTSFTAQRGTAKYCSASCRANASKGIPSIGLKSVSAVTAPTSGLVERLRAELEAAGVAETSEADAALLLAGMLADPSITAAARVTASKAMREAKDAALASAIRQDAMDEVTRKRDEKLRRARGA
jgi:hypothetical protein